MVTLNEAAWAGHAQGHAVRQTG